MKLLVKVMVVFATLYAIANLCRNVRVQWPFAFLATSLISLLGIASDRILMPKMKRSTAVLSDMLLIGVSLFGANKMSRDPKNEVTWPYLGIVSTVLGGFEFLYHEWIYNRERYEEHEGGVIH